MFDLTPIQEEYVARNGFVVVPSDRFADMADLYDEIKKEQFPVFVTSDALLHTAHLFFDYLLRIVELEVLRPRLVQLTQAMLEASADAYEQAADVQVKEAARRNLAYFSVGGRLLNPDLKVRKEVKKTVEDELELIRKRPVSIPPRLSPVMGIQEDYSQYVPRGHYTRNRLFRSYFLAAMWYGRMVFFVFPSESHNLSEFGVRRLACQALLITGGLHNQEIDGLPAVDVWRSLYEMTALFAGRAEDPGPDDIHPLAQRAYGSLPGVADLADESRLDNFLSMVRELGRPRVLSTYYLSKSERDQVTPRWQDGTLGFHFLAQRFVPDAHIFSELVWDRVGNYQGEGQPFTLFNSPYEGPYRSVPRGLDVLAAFGSELAERILREEGDTDYDGYLQQLNSLRDLYAEGDLGKDLYHHWLALLRVLVESVPDSAPAFMQGEAWAHKQCNTALGSWTELRHDTILYVKQSYTSAMRGAVLEQLPPLALVEPCPALYRGLGEMMQQLRRQLQAWELVEQVVTNKLTEFESLLAELEGIAARQLQGEWPTDEEMGSLMAIGSRLKNLLRFPPHLMQKISSGADSRMAMVVDVHTHPSGGVVLEEAVGDPFPICVDVERDGQPARYWGAVFSHYEFKQPLHKRLTDEDWQAMHSRPEFPLWTRAFLAEE